MFEYRVFDRGGNYLGRVEHERELVRDQCVMEDGTVYAGTPPHSSATFLRGQPAFPVVHLSRYEGLHMSGRQEAKREAEEQVSKELANQPKQDGPGKEESKDRRADAEEKLTK
jgi:hypothetical protein